MESLNSKTVGIQEIISTQKKQRAEELSKKMNDLDREL